MSALPIMDGGMSSCCIDFIRAFEGRDDDGVSIECETCAKSLVVKKQRWMWRPVETGFPSPRVRRWPIVLPPRQ